MCGGFAGVSAANGGALPWSLGRLTTYALLGSLVGAAGASIPGPSWVPGVVAGAVLVWFALGVAGLVATPAVHSLPLIRAASALGRKRGAVQRFAFGMATGLLPCGLVYASLALAIASGSAYGGALVMFAFGSATLPGLSVLSAWTQRVALTSVGRRRAFALVLLVIGGWSIGLRSLGHAHQPEPAAQHERHGR
jgi:uncharacterized protein